MKKITLADEREEDLSLKEELTRELSTRKVISIVVPFVFYPLISILSSYFERYANRLVLLFLASTAFFAILCALNKRLIAQLEAKVLLPAIGFYLLILLAFNWAKLTFFDPENSTDNISSQFLDVLVNAISFFLVWLVFQFTQKTTKN